METHHYTRQEDLKRIHFIQKHLQAFDPAVTNILDLGCGNGNISRFLGSLGYAVTGVDVDPRCITKARQLNQCERVNFEVLDAESFQMTRQYDVIICSEVLEHLHDPAAVLEQITPLLTPKGLLIITVPNGYGPRELLITRPLLWSKSKLPSLYRLILRLKKMLGYDGQTIQSDAENLTHLQFFSPKGLKRLFGTRHFELIEFGASNFVEGVFPFSLFSKRSTRFQRFDCWLADRLPLGCSSGFLTVWKLKF